MNQVYTAYLQPHRAFGGLKKIAQNYFYFEEDFIEDNVRCIPMYVRFKLDGCGIKLKLSEWSKMSVEERQQLSAAACTTNQDLLQYRQYLQQLIIQRTGQPATELLIDPAPVWSNIDELPQQLKEQVAQFNWSISLYQWQALSNLQRFALVKLCSSAHENKNLPKAIKEFGLA